MFVVAVKGQSSPQMDTDSLVLSFFMMHLFQAIMHHLRLPALLLVLLALLRCVTMAPSPR